MAHTKHFLPSFLGSQISTWHAYFSCVTPASSSLQQLLAHHLLLVMLKTDLLSKKKAESCGRALAVSSAHFIDKCAAILCSRLTSSSTGANSSPGTLEPQIISRKALERVYCVTVGTSTPIKHFNEKSNHDCFPPSCCVHHGQLLFSSSWSAWNSQLSMLILWEATASAVLRWSLGMRTTSKHFWPWILVNGHPSDCTSWDYQHTCDRSIRNCGRRPRLQRTRRRDLANIWLINTHLIVTWPTAECKFNPIEGNQVRTYLFQLSYSSDYKEWIVNMWITNMIKMKKCIITVKRRREKHSEGA